VTLPVKAAFVAALCLAAWPLEAADGLLIVEKSTSGGSTQTNQIQIEKDKMRAEMTGQAGEKQAVVFDGAKQVLWVVNYDQKSYNEMTKADVDRLGGQMSDATAQMQAQLKNLPPEQRAQVEAMMKGRGMAGRGGEPSPKTEYRKTGTDTVGKWTCDKYEGYQNSQKTSEVCAADPKTLGFAAADVQISKQLAEFFRKLAPQNADRVFTLGSAEDQGFVGVPVRRVTFRGQQQTITELVDVSRQTFAASAFEVPAGFKKEAIGGRGRQ
jgi:hypothetical protein